MAKYKDPKDEMKKFWKDIKKNVSWWYRPGMKHLLVLGVAVGVFSGIASLLLGALRPVAVGIIIGAGFFLFSALIRDGKKF